MNPEGGGCSELRLRHCTPAWATERDSVSKKKKRKKKENEKRKQGNSIIRYLNNFFSNRRNSEAKAIIGKEAVITHISPEREMFGHFGLDLLLSLTLLRHV